MRIIRLDLTEETSYCFRRSGDTLWWCSILGYSSYQLFRLWASPETGHETEPLVEFKVGVAIPDVPDLLQIVRCGYENLEVDPGSEVVLVAAPYLLRVAKHYCEIVAPNQSIFCVSFTFL